MGYIAKDGKTYKVSGEIDTTTVKSSLQAQVDALENIKRLSDDERVLVSAFQSRITKEKTWSAVCQEEIDSLTSEISEINKVEV